MHEEYKTNIRLAERGYWVSRVCMLLRLPTAGSTAMSRQPTTYAAWCVPHWLLAVSGPVALAASWSCRACYSDVGNLGPSMHLISTAHNLVSLLHCDSCQLA